MTCHTPIPCYATSTKFSLLHFKKIGFGPFHQEVGEFLLLTWEIIKNGINILVSILLICLFMAMNFNILKLNLDQKISRSVFINKKINTKTNSMNDILKHLKSIIKHHEGGTLSVKFGIYVHQMTILRGGIR
jgi:hypothetical protein